MVDGRVALFKAQHLFPSHKIYFELASVSSVFFGIRIRGSRSFLHLLHFTVSTLDICPQGGGTAISSWRERILLDSSANKIFVNVTLLYPAPTEILRILLPCCLRPQPLSQLRFFPSAERTLSLPRLSHHV